MSPLTVALATGAWMVAAVWWILRPYPPNDFWARAFGAVIVGLTAGIVLGAWVYGI